MLVPVLWANTSGRFWPLLQINLITISSDCPELYVSSRKAARGGESCGAAGKRYSGKTDREVIMIPYDKGLDHMVWVCTLPLTETC